MIGGVLIMHGQACRVFGNHVPQELLKMWHDAGKEHLIGQIELYALVVARFVWRKLLSGRKVIAFIDNWAVLDCYIPGTSREKTWRELLLCIEQIDFGYPSYIWATRVPSESNIADPPSRGSVDALKFLGDLEIDAPMCPIVDVPLKSCLTEADEGALRSAIG